MNRSEFDLRPFEGRHLDGAFALSSAARWPHRREDWAMMLEVGRGLVALDGAGTVAGTAFLVPYGAHVATIGMVIVDGALRGHGLGRKLVTAAAAMAGDRILRLVSTPDGEPLYRSLGFRDAGSVQQRQGLVRAVRGEGRVEAATVADRDAVTRLDEAAFGAGRGALIAALFRSGTPVVIRREGVIAAFAAIRLFGRGEAIGPIVAPRPEDARALVAALATARTGRFLRLDLVDGTGMEPWLDELGLVAVDRGAAMQTSVPPAPEQLPDTPTARTFALASQALG